MKRLLFILLLFPAILQAQNIYPIRGINRTVYSGDTLDTKFSADSTKFVTNNKAFVFNKTVKVNKDTLATNAYARSVGGSGGGLPSDSLNFGSDILRWDRANRTYKPYTSKPVGLGLYKSAAFPILTSDTAKLNGVFSPSSLFFKGKLIEEDELTQIYRSTIDTSGVIVSSYSYTDGLNYTGELQSAALTMRYGNFIGGYQASGFNIRTFDTIYVTYAPFLSSLYNTPFVNRTRYKFTNNLYELWQQNRKKISIDTSGIIHAQMPHIALYRNTDLTISAVQNAWYKLTGMTAKDDDFVTYQGDSVRLDHAGSYLVNMTISFSGLNNEVWELGLFKNSVLEEPSQLRYTGTTDVGNMSAPVYVYSDGNDWISFKIRNTTDGDDPTIKRISIVFTPMHLDL